MKSHSYLTRYAARGRRIVDKANEHGRTFGDTSDDWINDPERMARVDAAAENGADGSTHREIIEDQRENVRAYVGHNRDRVLSCAMEYLSSAENWHQRNGSLDHEVG